MTSRKQSRSDKSHLLASRAGGLPSAVVAPPARDVLVTYDIRDRRRWRKIYRLLQGYGEWVQLSVFHCRLTEQRFARLRQSLERLAKGDDHVLIVELGSAGSAEKIIRTIGKPWAGAKIRTVVV